MIFLSGIKIKAAEGYPFIPLIVNTPSFTFTKSVTVICGDNGCGKTTFAKIVATACRSACISEEGVFGHVADRFTALRKFIPKRSFYFSAEQFVQFVRDVEARREDAKAALREIDRSDLSDYAKSLAKCRTPALLPLSTGYTAPICPKRRTGRVFWRFSTAD